MANNMFELYEKYKFEAKDVTEAIAMRWVDIVEATVNGIAFGLELAGKDMDSEACKSFMEETRNLYYDRCIQLANEEHEEYLKYLKDKYEDINKKEDPSKDKAEEIPEKEEVKIEESLVKPIEKAKVTYGKTINLNVAKQQQPNKKGNKKRAKK